MSSKIGRPSKSRGPLSVPLIPMVVAAKASQTLQRCKESVRGAGTASNDSRSSTPVSGVSGTPSSRMSTRIAKSSGTGSKKKKRNMIDFVDDFEDVTLEVDYADGEDYDSRSNSDVEREDEINDLDGFLEESESVWSEGAESTATSDQDKLRLLPRRPKSPEFIDDREVPPLVLPTTSNDLLIGTSNLMQALGIYEVMRHFRANLRLSPFRFEDFCAAVTSDEQSSLLVEIHVMLLKSLFREDDGNNTLFGPQDVKDSINISLYVLDSMTWYECVRTYLDSDASIEFRQGLPALDKSNYFSTTISERLLILQTLTDLFLSTNPVREEITNEGTINYDDHCRSCHKLGDLLCCESCPSVYHLNCVGLEAVPEEEWVCEVCKSHQVKGVTDCISEVEKSGLLCRQEPIGYDRHLRKYWFLCRRIIIEGQEEVFYYSTSLQLDALLECLDAEVYEKDLVQAVNEMKDDIVKQMSLTEDLTKEFQGNRKSAIDIYHANLAQIKAEKAAREEEERQREEEERQREEEERQKEEEERQREEEMKKEMIAQEEDLDMDVTEEKTMKSEPMELNGSVEESNETMTADNVDVKKEPMKVECKEEENIEVCDKNENMSNGPVVGSCSGLKPKTITFIKDGSKMLMTVSDPNVSTSFTENSPSSLNNTHASSLAGRRIVTRSKTGSLTPKQFADSVMTPTTSLLTKLTVKFPDDVIAGGRDSSTSKLLKYRMSSSSTASLALQNSCFKLGTENGHRHYQNQFSTNALALNKNQHNEEREKRRHMSHKFSLSTSSEFSWNGSTLGGTNVIIGALRVSLLQFESNILAPFLHQNWSLHRPKWTKSVHACSKPEDFAFSMAVIEACMKPVLFNQVWHDALGHIRLKRTPVLDKEEVKKKERERDRDQKKKKDEDEELIKGNNWVKYSLGVRHQVWKQKGEEYRILGNGGWMWISSTRIYRYLPSSSQGLRLLAAKIQLRKKKLMEMRNKEKGQFDGDSSYEDGDVRQTLNFENGLLEEEKKKCAEEDENDIEDISSMKLPDDFNISESLTKKKKFYARITKPYSRLDHLLDRRLRQDEEDKKQKALFEDLIRKFNLQEAEKRLTWKSDQNSNDSAENGGNKSVSVGSRDSVKQSLAASCNRTSITGPKYQCYSALCRNRTATENHQCYSAVCRVGQLSDQISGGFDLTNGGLGMDFASEESVELENSDNEVSLEDEEKERVSLKKTNGGRTKIEEKLAKGCETVNRGSDLSLDLNCSDEKSTSANNHSEINSIKSPAKNSTRAVIDTTTPFSLQSLFQDGKLNITAELVEEFKARLSSMGKTQLKVCLAKRGPGRPSKTQTSNRVNLLKKGSVPAVHRFLAGGKKRSLFVLQKHVLRTLARREGKREISGFSYICKMNNVNWPYPCPRPFFKTAWEYRTQTMRSLSAVAVQLRILWACVKWDDMSMKIPSSGAHTITTESDITTTELLKRRDVGPYGLRSEFLVRKIVVPLAAPSQPKKEKYTPQRSGLRERRRPESPKLKEPTLTETWLPEENLELWEIKLFADRLEKQRLLAEEKRIQQQKEAEIQKKNAELKAQQEAEQARQRLMAAQKREIKITRDPKMSQNSATRIVQLGNRSTSSPTPVTPMLKAVQIQPSNLIAGVVNSASQSNNTPTVQNLRIIQNNGQLQVQGLLPGQQIIRLPDGRLHLITSTSTSKQQATQPQMIQPRAAPPAVESTTVIVPASVRSTMVSSNIAGISPSTPTIGPKPVIVGGHRILFTSRASSPLVGARAPVPIAVAAANAGTRQTLGNSVVSPQIVRISIPQQQQQLQQQQQQPQMQQPQRMLLTSGQLQNIVRLPSSQQFIISNNNLSSQLLQNLPLGNASSAKLATSPSSLVTEMTLNSASGSPSKYAVTPQILQQVVNQALMQTQDPDIQNKLLAMQKLMQQQLQPNEPGQQTSALQTNSTIGITSQIGSLPLKPNKAVTQEQKEEHSRLALCSQVLKGILDTIEKQEKQEMKRQRKQETTEEKARRVALQKLDAQLTKRKESLKKDILKKRSLMERCITTKIQTEIAQVKAAKQPRKTLQGKRQRAVSIGNVEASSTKNSLPSSSKMSAGTADLEINEPKQRRKKQKLISTSISAAGSSDPDVKLYCLCKTPYDESKFYIGCDRCQDWYHGSCVGVTKSEADRLDSYVCPLCLKNSTKDAMSQARLLEHHWPEIRKLVASLRTHKMAWPFLEPVSAEDVPDYHLVIKEPMDLATIDRKVICQQYSALGDFIKDVMKIFDNCRYYNSHNTPFYRCAEVLEIYFVEKLKGLRSKLKL